ncbi:MAG: hypothetical protein C6I01_00850 [Epsilonproteobacteria bacterium]|nr:hypothetical protein [Campylobacterota bacterium]NPA88596.1 AraC family transcriptional regulator [Campylobacterota bacterium]
MKDYLLIKNDFVKTEFKPHIHESFSIGKIINGECKLSINKNRELVKNSEIRIVNPLETHYVENNSRWSYINLFIEENYIRNIISSLLNKEYKSYIKFPNKINDPTIGNLFNQLNEYLDHHLNSISIEENITQLIVILVKKYSPLKIKKSRDINNHYVKRLVEYIYTHYLDDIQLQDLQDIAGINKYHIIRIFKQHFSLTPYQFILKLRIEHALKLMKKDYPLSLIAVESGFFDQSHFIKEFKKVYGITPLRFREQSL